MNLIREAGPDRPRLDVPALQRAALAYAERGSHVLPLWWPTRTGRCACGLADCDSAGKYSIAHLVPRGLHDATARAAVVPPLVAFGP